MLESVTGHLNIPAAFNFALKMFQSFENLANENCEEEEKEYEKRLIFVSIFILLLTLLTLV